MTGPSRRVGLCRRILLGLTLAGPLALAPAAPAQYGEAAGIAEAMRPEYFGRDLVLFVEGLELDDTQRVIVEALFDDYQAAFDEGFARMRQRYEDMRPELQTQDETRIMRLVFAPFEEWHDEKVMLGEQLRSDVQAILNEDQLSSWPAFMRRMVREKTMHEGRLAGESLDLFHIVRDMNLRPEIASELQPTLDGYDVELGDALDRRNEANRRMQAEMLEALQVSDSGLSLSLIEEQIGHSIAVRDVNDRYIVIIGDALPEDLGAEFRHLALSRAYPRVYRRTAVHRMFRAALELEDVDEETREMVEGLEVSYTSEIEAINDRLIRAIRAHDPEKARYRAEAFAARRDGRQIPRPDDPTREDFKRRDEIGDQYARSLQQVLSEDQFASLPGADRWLKGQARRASGKNTDVPTAKGGPNRPQGDKPGAGAAPSIAGGGDKGTGGKGRR
ncbi:MAG: hypothetical protein ACYTG1_11460 [Planctomycetota bacterium]|jgi:hypothetical protein